MIIGIGNDIIEIERVRKACESEHFLERCFTSEEIRRFKDYPQSLAGNYAAKEAVVKAMGTGFRKFYPGEIEVVRDEMGKPVVSFYGEAKQLYEKLGGPNVFVTISHCNEYAMATCVMEKV